jgi:GxxExxY protein
MIKGILKNQVVYQEALSHEFAVRRIPFCREKMFPVYYRGRKLESFYRADFVCYGDVIVEVKAQSGIGNPEAAQVINYLKASHCLRGVLLNFVNRQLQFRRLVLSR